MVGEKRYLTDFENQSFLKKLKNRFLNIVYSLKNFKIDTVNGIFSIFRWRKVIWNDRTWGYSELLKVMIFKLQMDSDAFVKRNILETSQEKAQQMRQVVELLKKYQADEYMTEELLKHDQKWGPTKTYWIDRADGTSELGDDRSDRLTAEQLNEERADYRKAFENAEKQKKEDLKRAFDIMLNNLDRWWD